MASTYSTLKIELIGTGEQAGLWGTTTNTNLGTAIEEAIVGSADVSFSSADVTLTLTDTNAAQTARNLRLNLTGTSGGARNLILGSGCQIEKPYLINNGLADTVTVKNTTGTGIAVPAGKTMWVYNNGTNVVDAVTHLSSLTLSTALPIASGGTGTTSTTFVNLATNVTGTLPVANGGSGQTSYTDGQLLIGNTSGNTLTKATLTAGTGITVTNGSGSITVAAVNNGTVTSVAVSGGTTGLTTSGGPITGSGTITIAGTLAVTNGGTGLTTVAQGDILYASGSNTITVLAKNTSATRYLSNTGSSNNPAWAQIDLSNGVTGTLPVANGGTGGTTQATGRTGLGATTVGANFFTLTNPSAITFTRINADNTVSALSAADFRTAIGAGTGGGSVTSVGGTGTVNGITLTGTVTSSGNLTLGGTLSGVSLSTQVTGTLPVANGGSGQTTAQAAMNAFAGATTSGSYLRGNGTNVVMSTIQAGDVPTLNQNTTGSAATLTTARTFQTNLASTSTASFNGSANVTPGVTGTLPVANGGTGVTSSTGSTAVVLSTTPVITGLREKSAAIAASDINLSLGNYFTRTISGTTTFTVSNVASSGDVAAFVLVLTNGGSATVNWFSGVTWNNATPPTLTTSGIDILGFFTINGGTTWRGLVLAQAVA